MTIAHKTQNGKKDAAAAASDDGNSEETENSISSSKKRGVRAKGELSSGQLLHMNLARHQQMSLLSSEYYYARHFWYMFLPSVCITMLSAIFVFASESELPK